MSGQMPGAQPGEPPEKKGLSPGCLSALIIIGVILLIFGVCIVALSSGGGG
jgi:hypothetical protein